MAREPHREECPWLGVEGRKQVEELGSKLDFELLLFCGEMDAQISRLARRSREVVRISGRLMKLISGVQAPQGVMAFVAKPNWGWKELSAMALYLEGVQDPGNLGTLLRTAQATGSSIVTGPGCVSFFNPKVVRASSATLFSTPFRQGASVGELANRGYRLWAAKQASGQALFEVRFDLPAAVMLGGEGQGLSPEALSAAGACLHVPMQAGCESLNVSVAGSLILYHAYRQRAQGDGVTAEGRGVAEGDGVRP